MENVLDVLLSGYVERKLSYGREDLLATSSHNQIDIRLQIHFPHDKKT